MDKLYAWFLTNWDLTAHALIMCMIVKSISLLISPILAVVVALGLGAYKEYVIDKKIDKRDVCANLLGIILGLA